ncbi:MAG: type II toxin-antitoxin system RelE/ParE family toxin [bacterium]|nr:type II toxin-antitoxin system RelE/ParE family toxin [bacterium]
MAEINWTEEAQQWLIEIHDYIADDNPLMAQKVINDIFQKTQLLKKYPEIGFIYKKDIQGDIRILLYGHYRIAYQIKSSSQIDILGIFHGALEIERYVP